MGSRDASPRSRSRPRAGRLARGSGAQIPKREHRVGLAIRVSGCPHLSRPGVRPAVAIPPARVSDPARGDRGRTCGVYHEARELSHVSAFVRDSPARGWVRHSHRPGTARARGCQHHHALHARARQGADGCEEPGGSAAHRLAGSQPRSVCWRQSSGCALTQHVSACCVCAPSVRDFCTLVSLTRIAV
jgi:hypothetical protein